MDRLSNYLTLMTGAVLTGSLVIAALALGYYSWIAIGISAAIGFVLAWPVAYIISQRIKKRDPLFNPPEEEKKRVVPDPRAPEV